MIADIPEINIQEYLQPTEIEVVEQLPVVAILPCDTYYSNSKVVIKSLSEFINKFGYPTDNNYKFWWNIARYLAYDTKGLYVVRPMKENDKNDSIVIDGNNSITSRVQVDRSYNNIIAMKLLSDDSVINYDRIKIINRYVSKDVEYAVTICSNEDNWNSKISNERVDICRAVDSFYPLDDSIYLNNKYMVKKEEFSIFDSLDPAGDSVFNFMVLSGNKTELNIDDNVMINNTIDKILTVESNYNKIISLVSDGQIVAQDEAYCNGNQSFLKTSDIILYNNDKYILSIDSVYDLAKDITLLKFTSDISYNHDDEIIINSETTSITLVTGASSEPIIAEYLSGEWNIAGIIDFNPTKSYFLINKINDEWIAEDLTEDYTTYIYKDNEVWTYDFTNDLLSKTELEGRSYDLDNAEIIYYDSSLYNIDNSLYSFGSIFTSEPDWDENEFGICLFKKNTDNLFELVEKFILSNTSLSEYNVYNNSEHVYIIFNKDENNLNVNTKDISIQNVKLYNTETSPIELDNINNYNNTDLQISKDLFLNTNELNVDLFIGFQKNQDITGIPLQNFFGDIVRERTEATLITSIWDEDEYLGKTEDEQTLLLREEFCNNYLVYKSKFSSFSSYSAVFGNMLYIEDIYRNTMCWIPMSGDLAGHIIEKIDKDLVVFGEDNPIKKHLALLVNIVNTKNRRKLNNGGVNNVKINSNADIVIADSITADTNKYSLMRELHKRLWSNKIKKYVRDYFQPVLLKLENSTVTFSTFSKFNIYLKSLKTKGILKDFVLTPTTDNDTLTINLKVIITDIIRNINFNIYVYNGDLNIDEV